MITISKKLISKNLNFKIDVIGEGVLQQKLLKLIEYHKLNKYIELKGHISNPYENLIEAEIDESFDEPLKEAPEIRHLDLIDKEIRNVFCPSGYNTNFRTSRARLGDFQGTERPNSFFKDFNKRVFLPFTTCIIASPNLT